MNASISFDTSGFDRAMDALEAATDPAQDPMREALLESSDQYHAAMRERFASYSLRGGDWAEHAPSTIKKRGAGAPILNETGLLEASMSRSAADHVLETDGSGVTEGTENRVAGYQHRGTPTIPARAILVDPDATTLDAMKTPIVGAVRGAVE